MENLLELYWEKLEKEASNPGNVITRFYSALFDIPTSKKQIIMFNKLIKLYGRYIVFYSVLDLVSIKELKHDNLYGLLHVMCRNRFERAHPNSSLPKSEILRTSQLMKLGEEVRNQTIELPSSSELG